MKATSASWTAERFRYLFSERNEKGFPEEELLAATQHAGVVPKRLLDFKTMEPVDSDLGIFKLVRKGDFVISLRSFEGGLEYSDFQGILSPAYTVLTPREKVHAGFFRHLLKSQAFVEGLARHKKGIRDGQAVPFGTLRDDYVRVPPLDEQERIANFLDEKTARIDALIAEKERLVALLDEYWQACLWSGLCGNGRQDKVTPYECYPSIPTGWDVLPFKYAVKFIEGPGIMAVDFRDEGVPLLRVSCVRDAIATLDGCNYLDPEKVAATWNHFRVKEGDLLISASASMGTVSLVTRETAGAVPYTGIIILRPVAHRVARDFIRHFAVSPQFSRQIDLLKAGATIQHFGPTHLSQVVVALPTSLDEQARLAAKLNAMRDRLAALRTQVEGHVAKLREYRSSLVSAAVTGQLDLDNIKVAA